MDTIPAQICQNVLSGLDSGPQMLKCLKRTPSQPSNVQNAAGDATWATLISRCPKGRPSVSLMPNGAPPRLLLTDLATPAGTGIDVDKISSQLEQFAWQGCQALSAQPHLRPNLAPKVKFGPKFGPRGQNWTPNPNLGLVWAPRTKFGPWGPGGVGKWVKLSRQQYRMGAIGSLSL